MREGLTPLESREAEIGQIFYQGMDQRAKDISDQQVTNAWSELNKGVVEFEFSPKSKLYSPTIHCQIEEI